MSIFEQFESNVRFYCRSFPLVFERAKGAMMYSECGKAFIDFFAGAGALNYGHNNDYIKNRIVDYIKNDGLTHGLDMYTVAKREFMETFVENVLKPRKLDYKIQFSGPTGANAVESALKLARKIKKRPEVFSFMGGFHGMSLGSLSATSNRQKREGAGVPLHNVTFMPFPFGFFESFDTLAYLEHVLSDSHSGIDKPAAIIVETIQAEGGVVVASASWLQGLREICDKHDILLICDEIQVGCGRTGAFFSFEQSGIVPDIVVMSKSISGFGIPMSLVLMKSELDIWEPGEHNGTFRGHQLAFVGAAAALEYREMIDLEGAVASKEHYVRSYLEEQVKPLHPGIKIRGAGLIWGIDLTDAVAPSAVEEIQQQCFRQGLIVETAGRADSVLKIMPPLNIEMELLEKGCLILRDAISSHMYAETVI
ncbi:diaminobutyrate--2-oxoglutarate transaminase [Paenibacillus algorifonticola]|uniref:diaminobutyrate--2-oxoglutarate transaminase n=1 Tax=Paenibacillus algorifonticola TaxID=684063 RepID=UPI003D279676